MIPHRPWFKVLVNTLLRAIQTRERPAHLIVLASVFKDGRCIGYRFRRVEHR